MVDTLTEMDKVAKEPGVVVAEEEKQYNFLV